MYGWSVGNLKKTSFYIKIFLKKVPLTATTLVHEGPRASWGTKEGTRGLVPSKHSSTGGILYNQYPDFNL